MQSNGFYIGAYWQRRHETPREQAARIKQYVMLARAAIPSDLDWYTRGEKLAALCQTDDGFTVLENNIARCISKDEGIEDPAYGYNYTFYLATKDPAPSFAGCALFKMNAGASIFQNCCVFSTQGATVNETDPRLVTYDVMRAHMMAIVWAFRPSWCTAAPSRLHDYLDRDVYVRPPIALGWMTWLESGLVKQMQPPPSYWKTIVEGYSDGSVFMANGKEIFDVENAQHLRQARAIHHQIDPLNYIIPFEGMCGRSPRVPPFPNPPPATWNAFDVPPE